MAGYNVHTDSDGVSHYVYSQGEPQSCALACMFMMENQAEQMTHAGGETRIKAVSSLHPGSLLASQLAGQNGGQGTGTTEGNISRTFASLGLTLTADDTFDILRPNYNFAWRKERIYEGAPALIMVGWYSGQGAATARNGGHFIVAARCTNRQRWVVVLDPWRGTMHELHGARGRYLNHGLRGWIDRIWYTG